MSRKRFNFTNIDPDLYREFKAACAHYGLDMRQVFTEHMKNVVADYHQSILSQIKAKSRRKKGGDEK